MKTVKSVSANSVARELYKAQYQKKNDWPVGITVETNINNPEQNEVLVVEYGYLPGTAQEYLNFLGYVCANVYRTYCEVSQRHIEAFVVYGRSN